MRHFTVLLTGLFLLFCTANAQVVQHGVVLKYNGKEKKTPLEGVSLVVRGALSTTSEKQTGCFALSFNTLKVGDRLTFRENTPALDGYEMYNKDVVENWNISPSQSFEIVMVDSEYLKKEKDELKTNTRAYYEAELSKIKKELEESLKQDRIQQEEYNQKLLEAEDEFYEKLKNIDNYIDQFVRIDLSTVKPAEQHILDLVSQGKFEEAIKAYEDLRLIESYEKLIKSKQTKQEAAAKLKESAAKDSLQIDTVYQSLKNQVKTYQLAGGKANFDKAGEILRRIALSDTTNFNAIYEFADFCQRQNDHKEAEIYYIRCLNLLQTAKYSEDEYLNKLSGCQLDLALLYINTQRFAESEAMYKSALDVSERLAKANPDAYEPYLAMTQMGLGFVYRNTQRFAESEAMFKSALDVFERLAKANPDAYEPYLAGVQTNLGILYRDTQRFAESEAMFKSALDVFERLAKANPHAYEPYLAMVQMDLGFVYLNTQRLAESEAMSKSALDVFERLAKANPDAYEPYLAMTQMNLGPVYMSTQRFAESEAMSKSALDVFERLAKANPDAYEPYLAMTQMNLGILYGETQRFAESEAMSKFALDVFERLAKANPDAYEPYLAMTQMNLGCLYLNTQRLAESEPMYKSALGVFERLAKANPHAYEPYLAMTQINLGILYGETQRFAESEAMSKSALDVFERLAKANPHAYEPYLATTKVLLVLVYMSTQRFAESESMCISALKINPNNDIAYTNLAAALLFQGKLEEAEKIYRQYKVELKDGFLMDFAEFERVGVIPEERKADVERIKAMLNE